MDTHQVACRHTKAYTVSARKVAYADQIIYTGILTPALQRTT